MLPIWLDSVHRNSIPVKNESIQISNSKPNFEGTFREAIWPILLLGQIFGVMPVSGIKSTSILGLKFKRASKRTIYGVIVVLTLVVHVVLMFWHALASQIGMYKFGLYCINIRA